MIHFGKSKIKLNLLILLAIAIGVAIFYGNTLRNGFVLDDIGVIQDNTYIHSLKYLPKIFTGCIWETVLGGCKAITNYYRPLQNLSYMLAWQISPNPWSFALVRLICFAVAVFLVFVLAKLLTKNFVVGLLSAFIFLIHPINTEAVNFSAPDLLFTIFVLLATIYYFLYRAQKNSRYLIYVYIFYALGILTKETAIMAPLIFLMLDLTYFKKKVSWFFHWNNLKQYFVYVLIFVIYMGLRMWVIGGFGVRPSVYSLAMTERIGAIFYLFTQYIQKFFWPYPLQFSYPTISVSLPQVFSSNFLMAIFTIISYIGLCFISWRKKWHSTLFVLIWFSVFLFPILVFLSSLNTLGGNSFAERYSFAPIIGFSVLIALLLEKLWRRGKAGKWGVVIFFGAVSLISFMVIHPRNKIWNNNFNMYTDALQKNPGADIMRYNLAAYYQNKKDMVRAKEQFKELIKRSTLPYIFTVYNVLGNIYYNEKNYKEALYYFEGNLKQNPPREAKNVDIYLELRKEAYNYIGTIYAQQGDIAKSLTQTCQALQLDPDFKPAKANLDYAGSVIQGFDNQTFMSFYNSILSSGVFLPASPAGGPSTNNAIQLKVKDCSLPQGCLLTFSSKLPKNEFLFSFLIAGQTDNKQLVRTRYFAFNPQTSEITLGVDHAYGASKIHFWLPACGGVYYEAEVQ